jgi:nucleoside-diphosphate-sugar epimerase
VVADSLPRSEPFAEGRTVVVTGAAGAVGRRVLARLEQDPGVARVVAIDVADVIPGQPKTEQRRLDLALADAPALLKSADTLVHLAFSSRTETNEPEAARVNVETTSRLLDAASASGVDQVVVVSSATVYGAWANNPVPLTEDAPLRPNPEFAYAVHKAQVERLVTDWADAHADASVAVLRPALALAEDGAGWITRCLTGAAGIRAGDNDPPMQFLHLDDLASAVEHVRRERLSGPFNVAPDGWIPGDTARALVGDGPRLHLPDGAATRLAEWSWRMRLGPMPPGLVPYTQYPWVVASDRLRASGWEPRWSNEEAFVAGHAGSPWSMLSPKRRQELALGAAGVGAAVFGVATGLLVRKARRTWGL